MTPIKKEKKFDCLKMKEEIYAQIYEETKNMTSAERIAYFNKPTGLEPFATLRKRNEEKQTAEGC